jgi:lipoprotein-anchoring transpeptidase ErfK/SrfK
MAEPGTATTPFTTSSFAMRRGKPFRDATKAARKRSNVRNNVAFSGTGVMPRIRLFAAALAAGAMSMASAQAAVTVTIDKSIQQMTVEVDGTALYHWPVSTGKGAQYDTPSGKFKAFRMEKDHFSKEWDDAPMPFSIFFTQKGHAIHGSYDVKRLGTPASHGCVRLLPANAEKLFALVQKEGVLNTTVILTGTAPSGAPAVARRRQKPVDEVEETYGRQQAQQPYGQPQYGQLPRPTYGNPYYAQQQQQYEQPRYVQPQYQQQYEQQQRYVQPQSQPQYGQPRGYYSRDPYAEQYQQRQRSIFAYD